MISIISSILILVTCSDLTPLPSEKPRLNTDYIIFGHFYGFCGGEECIEFFKITNKALFEDTNDFYPSSDEIYDGEFVKLDQSKFNKLSGLSFEIPNELLNETGIILGTPDAADGGGIYLQIPNGRYWLLDMNADHLPVYLLPLREQILSAIAIINK